MNLFRRFSSWWTHTPDLIDNLDEAATVWAKKTSWWRRHAFVVTAPVFLGALIVMGIQISTWVDVVKLGAMGLFSLGASWMLYRLSPFAVVKAKQARDHLPARIQTQLMHGVRGTQWNTHLQAWHALFYLPVDRDPGLWNSWLEHAQSSSPHALNSSNPQPDSKTWNGLTHAATQAWSWVHDTERFFTPFVPKHADQRWKHALDVKIHTARTFFFRRGREQASRDLFPLVLMLVFLYAFPWAAFLKLFLFVMMLGGWKAGSYYRTLFQETMTLQPHERTRLEAVLQQPPTGQMWFDETIKQARAWYHTHPNDPLWGGWLERLNSVRPDMLSWTLSDEEGGQNQNLWVRDVLTTGSYGPWKSTPVPASSVAASHSSEPLAVDVAPSRSSLDDLIIEPTEDVEWEPYGRTQTSSTKD